MKVQELLLQTLEDLGKEDFKAFQWYCQLPILDSCKPFPKSLLEEAPLTITVSKLTERYGEKLAVDLTIEILKQMNQNNLAHELQEKYAATVGTSTSSSAQSFQAAGATVSAQGGSVIVAPKFSSSPTEMWNVTINKQPSRSMELEGRESVEQDSSVWNKLEPDVNNADADEAPTYSLQSEAGCFECSVSGLRWVCKDNTSFKYQFCSWGEHVERMEGRGYMPAGPLMDLSVIAGKLNEVYLPHWICIENNPKILDKFAVLHTDDCGDIVEKPSEVTASHVKLTEPTFTLRGVLMKLGFPVEIKCNVLMYYKPNTRFLKLHVLVIPLDPALKQTVDKKKSSDGFKGITKPRPQRHLKINQGFSLTADIDTAKIYPEEITLCYDQDPNFYEVYIKNPDREFIMTLHPYSKKDQVVWTCEMRKDDHPDSGPVEAAESSTGSCSCAAVRDGTSTSSSAQSSQAAAAPMSAQQQSVIIAPTLSSSTTGALNINIYKQ